MAPLKELERQIRQLTAEIERRVIPHQALIQRLDTVPGLDRISAWTILVRRGFRRNAPPGIRGSSLRGTRGDLSFPRLSTPS